MKQCQVCKAQFANEDAFMIHLGVGAPAFHACNDETEMKQKGMTQNQAGEWEIDESLVTHRNNWAYLTAEPATYKTPIPICSDCGSPLNDDGTCPTCDDRDLADPDEHSLDEIVGEAMHAFVQGLTQEQEDTGPAMRRCSACGQMHPVSTLEFYCPLDPRASHA